MNRKWFIIIMTRFHRQMLDIFAHRQVMYVVWITLFESDIEKRRQLHNVHQAAEDSEGEMPPFSGVRNDKGSKVAKDGCEIW
jgi:hypothetical protein